MVAAYGTHHSECIYLPRQILITRLLHVMEMLGACWRPTCHRSAKSKPFAVLGRHGAIGARTRRLRDMPRKFDP